MRRPLALLCWPLLVIGLAGCGATVSTSAFKGEQHEVAQTVANLQADSTAGEVKKICTNDLASGVAARLGGLTACEAAIKNALDQVDNLEASVQSVQISAASAREPGVKTASKTAGEPASKTASAKVRSIHSGKTRESSLSLVKERGKWKISGLG
jgi:hypothetical protein